MHTEITDKEKLNGWILYDGSCRYCIQLADYFHDALTHRRFELAPLQEPWVRARLGLSGPELLAEMRLLKPDGKLIGGADALLEIGRKLWWTWPLRLIGRVPAVMELFRAGYRWIARHRHCTGGACGIQAKSEVRNPKSERNPKTEGRISTLAKSSILPLLKWRKAHYGTWNSGIRISDFLPLLVLPLLALLCQSHLAPWLFMWAMAFALYAGCKWITYRLAARTGETPNWQLKLGYLLAWPGMNAPEFFNQKARPPKPQQIEWAFAAAKTIFGACLLWGIARLVMPAHPLLAGWMGMIGIIFVLHFGLFHLLSLAWRLAGRNANPVMQNPLRAISLADFWGARWNTAFNELAFRFTFRPLRLWTKPAPATLVVFGLSGLIHELVISLPAHGGYGLPTLYFIAQGLGLVFERSRFGHHLGLGRGLRGWFFTLLVTAGPAFWLFHPPFIHTVILPMLTAIGAT